MPQVLGLVKPWAVVVDESTAAKLSRALARLPAGAPRPFTIDAEPRAECQTQGDATHARGATVPVPASDTAMTTAGLLRAADGLPVLPAAARAGHELATLVLTSGSSGSPKAVELTDEVWARRVHQPHGADRMPEDRPELSWLSFQPAHHTIDRKNCWETIMCSGETGEPPPYSSSGRPMHNAGHPVTIVENADRFPSPLPPPLSLDAAHAMCQAGSRSTTTGTGKNSCGQTFASSGQ